MKKHRIINKKTQKQEKKHNRIPYNRLYLVLNLYTFRGTYLSMGTI